MNGEKHGTEKKYFESGAVGSSIEYKNGAFVSVEIDAAFMI
jgi:antitoxin component YwqK of YwqJK toxin-antitoxin module